MTPKTSGNTTQNHKNQFPSAKIYFIDSHFLANKSVSLREATKKSSSTNGQAIKRGGGKGWAIEEKRTFFETFFLFCCHLKIKNILP